jgi:putative Holliday junction resolvase
MADPPAVGRLLGVDWGERRIGLALSDETQMLAQPLATLTRRRGKRFPMNALLGHLHEHQVVGVVVGLPLDASGDEGEPARAARALADDIARRADRPVTLWDERFTTARVRRAVHEMGGTPRDRPGELDALSATLLLQHFLDGRRGTSV